MTKKIEITWLSDSYECDDCGGSYAEGANVKIDGISYPELQFEPVAYCYDAESFTTGEVFEKILNHLGFSVYQDHG